MKSKRTAPVALALLLFLLAGPQTFASHNLTSEQDAVLEAWLREHPGHRRATVDDCGCATDVDKVRKGHGGKWGAVPDYHPYVVAGDLDLDGDTDFAVVLVDSRGEWVFLIFNGPPEVGAPPAFVDTSLDFRSLALFFGPPRPMPYRLAVGPFWSHGLLVVPKDGTYELRWQPQ